jgi:hypothetical protein
VAGNEDEEEEEEEEGEDEGPKRGRARNNLYLSGQFGAGGRNGGEEESTSGESLETDSGPHPLSGHKRHASSHATVRLSCSLWYAFGGHSRRPL